MAMFDFLKKKKIVDELDQSAISNQFATDFSDGALSIENAASNFIMNFDWTANTQAELIDKYREVANYNEVDFAIQDIINEMVSFAEDEDPVRLDLDDVEMSDATKKKIHERWEKICNLLMLRDTIHQRAQNFYVDGRLAYHKVVDKNNLKRGLVNVVELDPRYVTKVRNIIYNNDSKTIKSIDEVFVYNESIHDEKAKTKSTTVNGHQYKEALQLSKESLTYVTSGMTDPKTGFAIGWLHKAVKPANQLRMMENALVIYRITRAPERRVFYIDVGNLPKNKAEQYLSNLKNSYRNRMSYDPEAGSFKDQRHLMTMQEDFWLPRTASGKGTEVSTLPGGANLDSIEDVNYFLKRLYKALNIPTSRLEQDSLVSIGGRDSQINRDEMKFSKFVSKVRKRFNIMLRDLLRTELILSNIIKDSEWEELENGIRFVYAQDMYLEERKQFEMMRDRLDLAAEVEKYVGKYYSHDFMRSEILRQTDSDKELNDKQIKEESSNEQFNPKDEDDSSKY